MFGLVNLFICTLKNPTAPSAHADLALMDMVAGHFAHVEFITSSEMSFPFAREVAALARLMISRAAEEHSKLANESDHAALNYEMVETDGPMELSLDLMESVRQTL